MKDSELLNLSIPHFKRKQEQKNINNVTLIYNKCIAKKWFFCTRTDRQKKNYVRNKKKELSVVINS